ncbi:MAG: RnfABCDGE type electron transport complex subunit B [Gemmatimonadota bacterium]|nr:MAG: RnfABCDGE type electron transport complex subunit B [Gemmatimonadota bacterium]
MEFTTIMGSVAILGGVGLAFGTLISLAHLKLKVWEDPRIDAVTDLLPGTNCGACGQAGCRAFAEALVAGKIQPATCTVMGPDDITDVAEYLGVEAGEASKRVARLLCAGGSDVAVQQAEYRGLQTCKAAVAVAGGGKACAWGCLGLADCEIVCDFEAIYMNYVGLPVVIPDKCTACGDCVEACPLDLFVLMPLEQKLIVQCKNLLEGEEAEAVCQVACNACGRCAADAASGLIEMVNGLAVIDYDRNELATPDAIARCPTNAIVWVEGSQFVDKPELVRSATV